MKPVFTVGFDFFDWEVGILQALRKNKPKKSHTATNLLSSSAVSVQKPPGIWAL